MQKQLNRIGSLIRELREIEGWTQEQLANKTHLRIATISDIENGKCNFEFKTLTAISEALNCEVNIGFILKGG